MCGLQLRQFWHANKKDFDRIAGLHNRTQSVFLALNYFGACQEWNLAFQLRQIKRVSSKEIEVNGISVSQMKCQSGSMKSNAPKRDVKSHLRIPMLPRA